MPRTTVPKTQAPQETNDIILRYLGHGPLSIRGPRTGLVYYFEDANHTTTVHERDCEVFLRTGLFAYEESH